MRAIVGRSRTWTHGAGFYEERIDYRRPCVPALSAEDQAWADRLIAGERGA
jgi:hypothetical protein